MIYGQYLDQLKQQQAQEIASLKQQTGITDFNASTFNPDMLKGKATQLALTAKDKEMDLLTNIASAEKNSLKDSLTSDTSQAGNAMAKANDAMNISKAAMVKAETEKQKATDTYNKAMEKYNKIMALEAKIEKYKTLLTQYNNTMFYDSMMTYSKLGWGSIFCKVKK